MRPRLRLDDLHSGTSIRIEHPRRVIVAMTPDEVVPALDDVQAEVDAGRWAAGFLAYEAAAGLDPDAVVHPGIDGLPLVWFAISDEPDQRAVDGAMAGSATRSAGNAASGGGVAETAPWSAEPWLIDQDEAEHARRVALVHEAIARGETYQVNLTTRLRSRLDGDLGAAYLDLCSRQDAAFCAFLDLGRWAILSASPECFLTWDDETIASVPMKGTAPRGATETEDRSRLEGLLASDKDRAENVMIVDLIRNDLARISETGTVDVPALLSAEAYPTVWQLTSTVSGRPRRDLTLAKAMRAMFPCGSITGAPKLSTMEHIVALEDDARGIYCGAIGMIAPRTAASGFRASFSVAIRTILVDRHREGAAVYGVGGGVTWHSTAEGEYAELLAKARVLGVEELRTADTAASPADRASALA